MFDNSGEFDILGMLRLRTSLRRVVLIMWVCCSLLLIVADSNVTHPLEGNFAGFFLILTLNYCWLSSFGECLLKVLTSCIFL